MAISTHQPPAVIYCRVSSPKQVREGHGLSSQESRCREYAKLKNYAVIEAFHDEGVSGGLIDRPGMDRLLTFVRSIRDENPVVLIDDVSRLARGLEAHLQLRSAISSAGGKLESPSIEFGDDSDSRLIENLLASVSQHQRQKNAEQVTNRMRARAAAGYWIGSLVPGYRYAKVEGHGKLLIRDEPLASVVQESLESFANGRLASQGEVRQFLEGHACYPRGRDGKVHFQRVKDILTRPLYAGYIHLPGWGLNYVRAKHEGLISFETFARIQQRLSETNKPAIRKDADEDFALRGIAACAGCGQNLYSGWSKGRNQSYGYYFCRTSGCEFKGKNVRREQVHADVDELFEAVTPARRVIEMAEAMFRDLWKERAEGIEASREDAKARLKAVRAQCAQIMDRIIEADSPSLIHAYEQRLQLLEKERAELEAQADSRRAPALDFDRSFRTALQFLANPRKVWRSESLALKRMALNATFAGRLEYAPKQGFRTARKTLPFLVTERLAAGQSYMVEAGGVEPPSANPTSGDLHV